MRRPRASRIPISDAEPGIPGSALTALTQQGYTVGEVMGRSTAACAPRRGLDAQGRHVVIRSSTCLMDAVERPSYGDWPICASCVILAW